MPIQGVTFNGAFLALPGAYYADNVSAAASNSPPNTPPMVVIGYGWGPKPLTPQFFTNPQDMLAALRGGPVASYVPFIANPSPALAGASQITFIDASSNTRSAASVPNSGATQSMLLTSVLYGPPSNQLQYAVSAATASASGIKMTLLDNYANTEIVGDNLGLPLQVAYVGAAAGVTYSVVSGATSGTFTATSPNVGESVTIALGSGAYQTVSALVNALNGTPYYSAQVLSATNGNLPANQLTQVSNVSLPASGAGGLTFVPVAAYLQDPLYWVNNYGYNFATAASGTAAADTRAALPAVVGFTYFSGAIGGAPTTSGYAAALNVALTVPAWTVFCDANTQAVQALLTQHVETASSVPYGMWRRGFTGSSIGDSVAATQLNAQSLDSLQMNYLYPGVYATNTQTGKTQLYGGLYAAAMAAAIANGNQIALPLTNKPLNAIGVESPGGAAVTASQLAQLQNSGVMAVYVPQQTKIPTILSDITTWQADANVENTSSQQVACRYWLAYSVTSILQQYVGTIATPQSEVVLLNALVSCLNALIYTGAGSNGVLASWNKSSLKLNYNGSSQLASISLQAVLVGQNRYITCYATILPLNFTVSAAA